ncbi:hypothetical protein VXS03_06980 [Photobacterium sp. S4TG1]|uniref:hypothetical protein n=1 Tax=Photobacterium sp. S4TG1 TaxID=3114587 RepID=UPI002E18E551|nr:hypothetical protein [Photobacterium sp. S4TG1]
MGTLYNLIPELLKNNSISNSYFSYILAFLIVISIVIKTLKIVITFHENNIITRFYKRISSINSEGCDEHTKKYLNYVKNQEVFTLLSGIRTAPENAKMIMDLYLTGVVSRQRIKAIYGYLKPKEGKVYIDINRGHKVYFIYSFSVMFCFMLFGMLLYFIMTYENPSLLNIFIGLLIWMSLSLVGLFLGSEAFKYYYLKKLRESLLVLNKLANPEDNISLISFSKKSNKTASLDPTAN